LRVAHERDECKAGVESRGVGVRLTVAQGADVGDALVIGVATTQDLDAVIEVAMRQANMRTRRDHRSAVLVSRGEVGAVVLPPSSKRGSGVAMAANRSFLLAGGGGVPAGK